MAECEFTVHVKDEYHGLCEIDCMEIALSDCSRNVKVEPGPETQLANHAQLVKSEPSETDYSETASSQDTVAANTEWFRNVNVEPGPETQLANHAHLVKSEPSETDYSETASSQDTIASITEWFRSKGSDLDSSAEEDSPVKPTATPLPPPPAKRGTKRGRKIKRFSCTLCHFVTKRKAGMALHFKKHKRAESLPQAAPSQTEERNESGNDSSEDEMASKDVDASPNATATLENLQKSNGQRDLSQNRTAVDSETSKETAPFQSQKGDGSDEDTGSLPSSYGSNESLHKDEDRKSPQSARHSYESRGDLRTATIKEPLLLRCHVCPFTTKYQATLFLHIKAHANNKEKTLLSCQFCSYTTRFKNDLVSHARSHTSKTPHRSTVGTRAYGDKGNMVAHVHIRAADIPFKCDICPRQFKQKLLLRQHMHSKHADSEKVQTP
ncbi:zinc finger protein 37-like isoform X2 [Dermacentor albipictus]